jgi:hypothetical protein
MYRYMMLIAAASIAAGSMVSVCFAQSTREATSPPAALHPPVNLDADTLRSTLAPSQIGLKPQTSGSGGLSLPFGIDYRRDAKALVMPLNEKSEWGVGVGMNLNSTQVIELAPSSVLGLQPKRAPGLLLHKSF